MTTNATVVEAPRPVSGQHALQQRGELPTEALDVMPYGVLVADRTGRLAFSNKAAHLLLGLEGLDTDTVQLRCDGGEVSLGALIREHASSGAPRRRAALDHPEYGCLLTTLTCMDSEDGAGWVHMLVEPQPRRTQSGAAWADPLASFGHELRNLVTSMREAVALVRDGAAGVVLHDQRLLLGQAKQDADRMVRLIEDMLAASHVRSARSRMKARRIDVVERARHAVRSSEATATKAGVKLVMDEATPELWCHADADLLTQALMNLIGNSLKFTPPDGEVRVISRSFADSSGEEFVELAVQDTGPGLGQEEIDQILGGDGRTCGSSGTNARKGLGIGLSIVRDIAGQHCGRLTADSEPRRGTCFRLILPVDFRRSEHQRVAHIHERISLAQALGVALSVVEIAAFGNDRTDSERTVGKAFVRHPLFEHCVEASLRSSDTVHVGEESATLVLYDADRFAAERVADRLVGAMRQLLSRSGDLGPQCELAYGVASYPVDGLTAAEVAESARQDLLRRRAVRPPSGDEEKDPEVATSGTRRPPARARGETPADKGVIGP